MLKTLTALCLFVPAAAQAFTQCTMTAIGGPGASIVEEGSNPVVAGGWTYAGYTQGSDTAVVAATDGGATLGAPVVVSEGKGRTTNLRLAVSDGRVYAVWQQGGDHGRLSLMIAASHDHAQAGSWGAPIRLAKVLKDISQVAADASGVHVVYVLPVDGIDKGGMVAVSSSNDSGRSFSAPVELGLGSGEVVVASHRNHVYVAWETGTLTPTRDVMLAVSDDGGASYSVRDVSGNGVRNAREPILSLNQTTGRLSLVWREDTPTQGVYVQSKDNGKTWSDPLIVDLDARQVMVQDDDDRIWISYLKPSTIDGNDDWQVYLALSTDGGKTFPDPVNLSGPTGISKLEGDDDRPIPWALEGKIRLTAIAADGAHIWSGQDGHLRPPVFLGPGTTASTQGNVAAWQGPNGYVDFASCK